MIDFIIMVWGNVEKMGFLLAVAMLCLLFGYTLRLMAMAHESK
jgi:hypothetical protein